MGIDALKTQAIIVSPPNMDVPDVNIKVKCQDLEIAKEKKKLFGIIIDNDLKFNSHITTKNQAFKSLKGIEHLVGSSNGCGQDTIFHLYKTLVLPVMDYRSQLYLQRQI